MAVFNCSVSKYANRYFLYYFMILIYKYKIWLLYSSVNISCKVLCCLLNWSRIIYVFYLLSFYTIHIFYTGNDGTASQNFCSTIWRKISAKELKIGKPITTPLFCLCKVFVLLTSCFYNMWFLYNWYWCHQRHGSTHWLARAFSQTCRLYFPQIYKDIWLNSNYNLFLFYTLMFINVVFNTINLSMPQLYGIL